jgi:hypothetical protein
LMTNYLVRSLAYLSDKRVNALGVSKIIRNIFALQQNLTNIDVGASAEIGGGGKQSRVDADGIRADQPHHIHESRFDRARQYYELLTFTQENLHLFQLENPNMFSAIEYAALFTIST